jgi:hypothetical protein
LTFVLWNDFLLYAFYLPLVYITFQILEIKQISNSKIKQKPYTAKSKQKTLDPHPHPNKNELKQKTKTNVFSTNKRLEVKT